MKAAVSTRYGPPDVLRVEEVARPAAGRRDLLVRVHAAAVTASDCYVRSAVPMARLPVRMMIRLAVGIARPRRPVQGMVFAGEVVETGRSVQRFRVGERVMIFNALRFGGYGEYASVAETRIVATAPHGISHVQAAALPYGGLLALHFLKQAKVRAGEDVLVYGASGAIGSAAVQLAKHFGARVTAVCGPGNVELVRSLGADEVLDYTARDTPGTARFGLVFDAVGRRKTSALKLACESALGPGGRCVSVDGGRPSMRREDLAWLAGLVEEGRFVPVVDRTYPLEAIADAHRYVELGHKKGNVLVTL